MKHVEAKRVKGAGGDVGGVNMLLESLEHFTAAFSENVRARMLWGLTPILMRCRIFSVTTRVLPNQDQL